MPRSRPTRSAGSAPPPKQSVRTQVRPAPAAHFPALRRYWPP